MQLEPEPEPEPDSSSLSVPASQLAMPLNDKELLLAVDADAGISTEPKIKIVDFAGQHNYRHIQVSPLSALSFSVCALYLFLPQPSSVF